MFNLFIINQIRNRNSPLPQARLVVWFNLSMATDSVPSVAIATVVCITSERVVVIYGFFRQLKCVDNC